VVRKQCFEVGCLGGGSSSRSVGLYFRLAVTQSCIFCGFWKKKKEKKISQTSFAGAHITRNAEMHQRGGVCCLGSGGEDATSGITASLLRPKPMSQGINHSNVAEYESQVPDRGS